MKKEKNTHIIKVRPCGSARLVGSVRIRRIYRKLRAGGFTVFPARYIPLAEGYFFVIPGRAGADKPVNRLATRLVYGKSGTGEPIRGDAYLFAGMSGRRTLSREAFRLGLTLDTLCAMPYKDADIVRMVLKICKNAISDGSFGEVEEMLEKENRTEQEA